MGELTKVHIQIADTADSILSDENKHTVQFFIITRNYSVLTLSYKNPKIGVLLIYHTNFNFLMPYFLEECQFPSHEEALKQLKSYYLRVSSGWNTAIASSYRQLIVTGS